jgi:hypothetical protein
VVSGRWWVVSYEPLRVMGGGRAMDGCECECECLCECECECECGDCGGCGRVSEVVGRGGGMATGETRWMATGGGLRLRGERLGEELAEEDDLSRCVGGRSVRECAGVCGSVRAEGAKPWNFDPLRFWRFFHSLSDFGNLQGF